MEVVYRKADNEDLTNIANFTDFWIGGLGISVKVPGAGHDFFVPKGRHSDYIRKYDVLLATYCSEIVGWAVKTNKGVLIHLLVAGTFRGSGIGRKMLDLLKPDIVRSKIDQSTGDPAAFYNKAGYIRQSPERFGRKKNIEIYVRKRIVGAHPEAKLDVADHEKPLPTTKNSDISADENWDLELPAESSAIDIGDWL